MVGTGKGKDQDLNADLFGSGSVVKYSPSMVCRLHGKGLRARVISMILQVSQEASSA